MRLTQEARDFYDQAIFLKLAWRKFRAQPFDAYVRMRFFFFLENMRYDTHNGLKLACDLIEKSGLVVNDNLILPEIMAPVHAKDEPRLLIEFPIDL